MEILVPVWPARSGPRAPKRRPRQLRGASIAIVDDNLDAAFTGQLEAVLQTRTGAHVRRWLKPSGTAPAPKELIEEVAGWADAAIVGVAL
ncbi:MAG: hypothetical protein HY726_06855 [Candidatus Rokubacteria bacterium]|nr:hypothetical protein [Candidatus Rokubacteria bacterium]